jgi:hypothetical protein
MNIPPDILNISLAVAGTILIVLLQIVANDDTV